jgi:hypothetical protein
VSQSLVCCYNRIPETEQLIKKQKFTGLQFWRVGDLKSRYQKVLYLLKPISSSNLALCTLNPPEGRKGKCLQKGPRKHTHYQSPFIKVLVTLKMVVSSYPHLLQALPASTVILTIKL